MPTLGNCSAETCCGCPLRQSCLRNGTGAGGCVQPGAAEFLLFTLVAFCVIRFGFTGLSVSMHLRPDYDANIYHVIGRAWMQGVLPYRDLADIKGPLAFLECGLGSLADSSSFAGTALLHSFVVGAGLLYACKTAALLLRERLTAFAVTGLLTVYVLYYNIHPSVTLLTLQYVTLFHVMQWMVQGSSFTRGKLFLCGFGAAAALLSKFNLAAFWVMPALLMLAVRRDSVPGLLRRVLWLGGGSAVLLLPFAVYAGFTGLFEWMWREYVLAAVEYAGGTPALLQENIRLFAQMLPDHLYLYVPLCATIPPGILLTSAWVLLPRTVQLRHPVAYYGVWGCTLLLGALAVFGGPQHHLPAFFSFQPLVLLGLVAAAAALRQFISSRIRLVGRGLLLAFPAFVVVFAVGLPLYVKQCKPEKGLQEYRRHVAAMAELLRGHSFLCADAQRCVFLYRLADSVPPLRHFVPLMSEQGYAEHRRELVDCIRSRSPRYIVCTTESEADTRSIIDAAGGDYGRISLPERDFPPLSASADYPPFVLFERK